MEDFTVNDLVEYTAEVHPVELLGKRAYLRALTLDGQEAIAERFKGREGEDAKSADLRFMLACLLCDSAGNLIFEDFERGAQLLAKLDHEELLALLKQHQDINGQDIEAEKKPLEIAR